MPLFEQVDQAVDDAVGDIEARKHRLEHLMRLRTRTRSDSWMASPPSTK